MVALLACLAFAQNAQTTVMDVSVKNTRVGKGYISERILSDGGKRVQFKIVFDAGATKGSIVEEMLFNSAARPIRKYVRRQMGSEVETTVVDFNGRTAVATQRSNGVASTKRFTAPAGAHLEAVSEFWFIKAKPPPGDVCTYTRFDVNKLQWMEASAKYVGIAEIEHRGAKRKVNQVDQPGVGSSYVDDDGRPVRIEAGNLLFVRCD